jgi:KDO2-lipid IV(A) lauroyltransferase
MAPATSGKVPLHRYWQPRFWPLWLALALLRLLVLLPYRAQIVLGRGLGRLGAVVMPRRRAIAAANLRLCFPELGPAELDALLRRHFESLGISLFELGLGWWAGDARIRRLARVEGVEHLRAATRDGRGAILLSGHFATIELMGRAMRLAFPDVAAVYRAHRNPLLDEVFRRGRSRCTPLLIAKDSIRQALRYLAHGTSLWYAADQSYRRKYSVLVPFLGEPAMTNAALSHIARLGKAPVLPFFPRRLPGGAGYIITVHPPLEGFPTGDLVADARRVNAVLEAQIRLAPEQYYWVHRRFKGRPEGYADPYAAPAQAATAGSGQALR